MAIIKQFDKRSGITYVYDSKSYYAVVLRSNSGGQHICDTLTIIETAKMRVIGQNVLMAGISHQHVLSYNSDTQI